MPTRPRAGLPACQHARISARRLALIPPRPVSSSAASRPD